MSVLVAVLQAAPKMNSAPQFMNWVMIHNAAECGTLGRREYEHICFKVPCGIQAKSDRGFASGACLTDPVTRLPDLMTRQLQGRLKIQEEGVLI